MNATAVAEDAPASPAGLTRGQFGWALFEFARAPTGTLIFMFIFAPYFAQTVVGDPVHGQEVWSLANTIAGGCIAVLAPLIGAAADRMGNRKPWLVAAVVLMALATSLLWFAKPGGAGPVGIPAIFVLIVVIGIAMEGSVMVHNAMLASVAGPERVGRLSGLGYGLGNVASFSSMMLILLLFALPASQTVDWAFLPDAPAFGLDADAFEHARVAGPIAALWLLLAATPFFLWTPDRPSTGTPLLRAFHEGLSQLLLTVRRARRVANVGKFLIARMIYNDAIVAMQVYCAIYAAGVFGWDTAAILMFALMVAACCFVGSLVGGWIDTKLGSKRAIIWFLAANCFALIAAVSATPTEIFFIPIDPAATGPLWDFPYFQTLPEVIFLILFLILAVMATVVLVSSRAMMAKISPLSLMTQFFGLFALSGFATAFIGHGVVAWFTATFESQRIGFVSVIILMMIGIALMFTVREERAPELG